MAAKKLFKKVSSILSRRNFETVTSMTILGVSAFDVPLERNCCFNWFRVRVKLLLRLGKLKREAKAPPLVCLPYVRGRVPCCCPLDNSDAFSLPFS